MSTNKNNLDIYLSEIFNRFVALKDDDCKRSQEVFKSVFEQFKQKMSEQCNFFRKYSSQVLYAGSVYDNIKVSKLDEFDMDIVIRLPINYDNGENGIIIENDHPGYVKLKIINGFDNLDKQKDWENCHKVTRDWRDSDKYFLQNKFRSWLHGIVQKTINQHNGQVTVNGVTYLMKYKIIGPAFTLNIHNVDGDDHFSLDVDIVPVIRFQLPRWPKGYRELQHSKIKDWLVVPKPLKTAANEATKNRLWRLSFQDFEREMMKDCHQLKNTIRLVKKLRDACEMKAIASYYIKTIFLWKMHELNDKKYWQTKQSVLFREMVEELHKAIIKKNIPYFWNRQNNLLQDVKGTLLDLYAIQLQNVLSSIDANEVDKVAFALLNAEELRVFKDSEFYRNRGAARDAVIPNCIQSPVSAADLNDRVASTNPEQIEGQNLLALVTTLSLKVEELNQRIIELEKEVNTLKNENRGVEKGPSIDSECSICKSSESASETTASNVKNSDA